jgi:hypothetical protein
MRYTMGELVIGRPVDEIFDAVTDHRHELSYDEDAVLAYTAVQRPHLLSWTITSARATACGTLRFEQSAAGTRVRWCWTVRPKGIWRLVAPFLVRRGERRQQQVWSRLEHRLQTTPRRESILDVVLPVPAP